MRINLSCLSGSVSGQDPFVTVLVSAKNRGEGAAGTAPNKQMQTA